MRHHLRISCLRTTAFFIACFACLQSFSQDTTFLKIHFLYGSKPLKKYKNEEPKWFGGIMGGHCGIEEQTNEVLSFTPHGTFHWFAKKENRHSSYAIDTENEFYAILGGNPDSVKKAVIYVPVSNEQKKLFDSISLSYVNQTPYDYALFGMRCGAATYEILGQLGVLPKYSNGHTSRMIFYPKKLRKRLFKMAETNGWKVERYEGSKKRKWEKD
jgi:hypothetical protein